MMMNQSEWSRTSGTPSRFTLTASASAFASAFSLLILATGAVWVPPVSAAESTLRQTIISADGERVTVDVMPDASNGQAPTFGWRALVPDAQRVGQGQFRRFGFLIYDATLWAPAGRYQSDQPFALELRYARTIRSDQIVDASLDQMQQLGVDVSAHPDWRSQLQGALTDVRDGDVLTGVYVPGRGGAIYRDGVRLGSLDQALAEAFFAIWLDQRTSDPDLRAELLGRTD